MMPVWLAILGAAIAILVGMTSLITIGIKFMLVPYLAKVLIDPEQKHRQQVLLAMAEIKQDIAVFTHAFDGHLDWSQKEVDRIWRQLQMRRIQEQRRK